MVQSKKQTSSKPKFAEVIIGDKETKEMYEATNTRPRRNPYFLSFGKIIMNNKKKI